MRYGLFIASIFSSSVLFAQKSLVGPGKAIDPFHYTTVKTISGSKAAVASAHPLASKVGTAILQQGGNAFDAAIATQLALAVVYPAAGNIGGGGFMLARRQNGTLVALDYREKAPAAATRDMYLDASGNAQTTLSQNGHRASGVPGTVAGLFATAKYGKLPFAQLIQPAIELALHGFAITEREARSLNYTRDAFLQYNTQPIAFVKNTPWKAGDTLIQTELAATLTRIRDNGMKGFYEGTTAQLIAAEMQRGNGLITTNDLKQYQAKERTPVQFNYRGYTIIGFPPPSSGGILLAQMLKMVAPYPLAQYGFQSVRATQLMTEAERRAYADRAQHMGDPDYWKVPSNTLMSDAYLKQRMADYSPDHATPSSAIKAGLVKESDETTHLSVIDAAGNMVTVTTTLNGGYGCRTVVGGAGFFMNNEMDDFSIKPGVPNMYGAVGGEANAIAPGKRMLSSMTPTLVLQNKQPFMVTGTPGGTTIPTSIFQTIVNVIDFKMNATDAVNQPKFHHQWLPDEIDVEKAFPDSVRTSLTNMGYTIKELDGIGRVELICIKHKNGKIILDVAADGRGDDDAEGF
ncbi:gamma-glutamyltransferase [Deminuibacter soli]|uniref:Glutathione hydrolase proenzyme n=2 Tax=Deminuibacter soli TaxID=2291815 RepID=A0A3E1NCT6_9BACT|nr:gamma-glutamyltransferase [Deminuibacter soli]